jgi:oxygen-independent coproporphyrinogen-3 oxidase
MRPELLPYLDKRIPRYTSYPTAVQFGSDIDGAIYANWLENIPSDLPLSLYIHVPFCAELCLYCGCHTSVARTYSPVAAYVDLLERELALVSRHLQSRRRATHVHWGGGTPTMLSLRDFHRLADTFRRNFYFTADCEMAVEIDPRTLKRETVDVLADIGITRASLGIQDFDEGVQAAVKRIQSFEQTALAADWLRTAGIDGINVDLMYGLPYQTAASVAATTRRAVTLDPDRIALFGYAHVPWMKKHQQLLPEAALPSPVERFEQYLAAAGALRDAGYKPIGLDHFAKPHDLLARRERQKRLHRNFQGYTSDEAPVLIGLGTSAISTLPQGYAQNAPSVVAYRQAIEAGRLSTVRGRLLTDDDRMRREIIEQLMCNLEVDLADIAAARNRRLDEFSAELSTIDSLAEHGLVHRHNGAIAIPEDARPFVRTVCATFDTYLSSNESRHSGAI